MDNPRARFLVEARRPPRRASHFSLLAAPGSVFDCVAMPPLPPLVMSSPHGLGTPRTRPIRPRAQEETLPPSARHVLQPQVGLNAMISALGGLKAPWEVSATQKFTPRSSHPPEANRRGAVGEDRIQLDVRYNTYIHEEHVNLQAICHTMW